ncbi:unnamed protein product, partial [Oikopleura dioica]
TLRLGRKFLSTDSKRFRKRENSEKVFRLLRTRQISQNIIISATTQ